MTLKDVEPEEVPLNKDQLENEQDGKKKSKERSCVVENKIDVILYGLPTFP